MRFIFGCLIFILYYQNGKAQDLLDGLVGYYSFCGCNANDHSGSGNHASLYGTPECIAGINGEGFRFNSIDRTNDCGQLGGEFVLLPYFSAIWADGISVCAWVQYESVNYYERIIDLGNGSGETGGNPIWFGREGNSNNLTLESWINNDPNPNRSTGRLVAQDVITNGKIELYGFTIAGDLMSIYVNGELVAQKRGHPILNVPRDHNYIGRSNWCYADPDFKGFMDEVRIYNRALTEEEMMLMYESPFQAGGDTSYQICKGEITQLKMQGGISYEWQPSPSLSALDIADPMAFPEETTTYEVEIFFPDGCSFSEEVEVEVFQPVETEFNLEICDEEEYYGYNMQGTYTDEFVTQFGCDSTRTVHLSVLPRPTLDLELNLCFGESYNGYGTSGIHIDTLPGPGCDTIRRIDLRIFEPKIKILNVVPASCQHSDGEIRYQIENAMGTTSVYINGIASREDGIGAIPSGQYQIKVIDNIGCQLDTLVYVPEEKCPMFIPNVFSPNGDGHNDYFEISSPSIEEILVQKFVVFDRWGNLVFQSGDFYIQDGQDHWWDGGQDSRLAETSIYIYFLEVQYKGGENIKVIGDVLVVR